MTDAAGAIVDADTTRRAREMGLGSAQRFLDDLLAAVEEDPRIVGLLLEQALVLLAKRFSYN